MEENFPQHIHQKGEKLSLIYSLKEYLTLTREEVNFTSDKERVCWWSIISTIHFVLIYPKKKKYFNHSVSTTQILLYSLISAIQIHILQKNKNKIKDCHMNFSYGWTSCENINGTGTFQWIKKEFFLFALVSDFLRVRTKKLQYIVT